MSDGPVGVVRKRVDRLDREHWAFEGGHAVEGHADHVELEHWIGGYLVPGPAQGQKAVEHATPGRRIHSIMREDHSRATGKPSSGNDGVEQMVRPGPDVDEHQRPKVHDRQSIAVHRPIGRLRAGSST